MKKIFPVLMLSCAVLVSCDSGTSEEVEEIIANREANPYQAPVISTGSQVNVNATDGNTYVITFPLNGEAEIEQLGGFFDVEAAFNYDVTDDELAVLTLALTDEVLGDVDSDYLDFGTSTSDRVVLDDSVQNISIDAGLRSTNAVAQALALNQIFAADLTEQAYFDVDVNGDLFLVEAIAVEILEERVGRFVVAGRQIEIEIVEEDDGTDLIETIDLNEVERDGDSFASDFFLSFDQEFTARSYNNSNVTVFE